MNHQTLILDLDDTLIHCNKYFKESRNRFAKQMQKWFKLLSKEEIIEKQAEFDIGEVAQHGLHSSVYPHALVLTYQYFCGKCGREMKETEMNQIRTIGQSVFKKKVQPFPYMYKILNRLQKDGHHLHLFTGGDEANQYRKIEQLGLQDYFEKRIFIHEHKNTAALEKVLTKIKADKKNTWMIGNSLKTDIKPAMELGLNAIHIPAEIEWSYNMVDFDIYQQASFTQLKSLVHLPAYLNEQYSYNSAIKTG
ncbi:MAG: HAD family hydrolase [Bacillus sp. (in: Bacteria)]|nr:HAD family hydrolase [Bacillus sp. (in: firmicutes)]